MDITFNVNLCKIYFASMSFFIVFFGTLVNIFESYLPVFFAKTFRYGKFACKQESPQAQKVEVPKSYFRHFYILAALMCPFLLHEVVNVYIFNNEVSQWVRNLLDLSCGPQRKASISATHVLIAVILFILQIFRRFYDTHFVSIFSKNATMNFAHYFIGMTYYPAVIIIVLSEAPKFASEPGSIGNVQLSDIGITEIFAILLFFWAWYHQHITTVILANLRKNKKGDVVTQSYQIPKGDWFTYLSSPHSTAEIVMYTALTILLSSNTGWWYVYVWVITNQVETILLSHWWYQNNFEDFPKSRKALIPFVY